MKPLNPFDISFTDVNLVEASAGTGKTYNITSLYIRALIESRRNVNEILVVTYTEAATKELKERLLNRINETIHALEQGEVRGDDFLATLLEQVTDPEGAMQALRKAARSFDEASVYTIHGFCYQALQEQAFESGSQYDAELIGDDSEVILEVVDDYWRTWVHEASKNRLKKPFLKYLTDKGYNPDTLTGELAVFVGKPYLEILPGADTETADLPDTEIERLWELFTSMKKLWSTYRSEISSLLQSDHLKNYRTDWLEGWMSRMDEWINTEVPPIEVFDKFEKFTQPVIAGSLKKPSEEKGIDPPDHPFFSLADEYQRTAASLQGFEVFFRKNLLTYLRDKLEQKKEELQILSYDDLLLNLERALSKGNRGERLAGKLRDKFPVAMVDEFQDTDPVQYDIFRKIYKPGSKNGTALFMIGDPKQSIYSFRGADIFAYLKAKNDAPGDKVFSLNHNFRSVPEFIDGLNTLFNHHENPFLLHDISYEPVTPGREEYRRLSINGEGVAPVTIRNLTANEPSLPLSKSAAEERAATAVAAEIDTLIRQGKEGNANIGNSPVQASDMAVLVRTHAQGDFISDALRRIGIKSVQYSQESVFESVEAEELEQILKAVAEPSDEALVKTALSTALMGYNAIELLQLEQDEKAWIEKLKQFIGWNEYWNRHEFSYMFRSLLRDANIAQHIMGHPNGERKLTNVLHLGELLQAAGQKNKRSRMSLIKWLARKRKEANANQEEEQLRLESDEELVKIVTMHRSKGLEYPIVFCPFLWHAPEYSDRGLPLVFHNPEDPSKAYLDLNGKQDPGRAEKRFLMAREELAESIRLAYVALTRAEKRCCLYWAHAKKTEYSPLGYLLNKPDRSLSILRDTISSENKYKPLGGHFFDEALHSLSEKNPGIIEITSGTFDGFKADTNGTSQEISLEARTFTRTLPLKSSFHISSFSSLTRSAQKPDHEELIYGRYVDEIFAPPEEELPEGKSIFSFPRGPQPGTCIHQIFEEIDFSDLSDAPEIIEQNLSRFGIATAWKETVLDMLKVVVSHSLPHDQGTLMLSNIEPSSIIPELEFYYPSETLELSSLLGMIRGRSYDAEMIPGMSESGFMKGFIDLTFQHNNRFYLLDYKTNYLGDTITDYTPEKLGGEIKEASYDLQYYLYAIALHRFLKRRLPGYSYKRHFGGAFYLFVRGMHPQGNGGIYFDRPEEEVIVELDQYIREGKEA